MTASTPPADRPSTDTQGADTQDTDTQGERVAVVLGASGTIGAAVAGCLAAGGWAVVAHGHRSPPPGPVAVRADLTDWASTRAMADDVLARFGPPEAVVNCAGQRDDGLLAAQAPDRWLASLNANVAAAYHPVRAFLPDMVRARRGSVVQVASVAALVGSPGQTAYAAAKAAIVAMSRSLAVEYGPRGLRFNAVAPGFLDSAMTVDVGPRVRAALEARQALPGTVAAADVARVVALLVDTPSITGQVVPVDMGLSA
jgi:3-oxoacyl-[acyl-carrier protein] reductase